MRVAGISTLIVLAAGGTAMANGIIRSPNLTSTNAAFSISASSFSWSSAQLSSANPSNTTVPFAEAVGSSGAMFHTDVDANPTSSSNYKSNFPAATTTSQLSKFEWLIGGNLASAGGNRAPIGSAFSAGFTSQTYSGDTSSIKFSGIGGGTWKVDVTIDTTVVRVGSGQAYAYSKMTVKRLSVPAQIGIPSNDGSPIIISMGTMTDLDVGANGGSGDSLSLLSAPAGDTRIKFTDSVAGFGEAYGVGADSYRGVGRSTLGTAITSGGASSLGNTLGAAGDNAAGFTWNRTLNAVGDSVTVESRFSIGTAALPTPGSAALVGLAGVFAARRRRA